MTASAHSRLQLFSLSLPLPLLSPPLSLFLSFRFPLTLPLLSLPLSSSTLLSYPLTPSPSLPHHFSLPWYFVFPRPPCLSGSLPSPYQSNPTRALGAIRPQTLLNTEPYQKDPPHICAVIPNPRCLLSLVASRLGPLKYLCSRRVPWHSTGAMLGRVEPRRQALAFLGH